MSGGAEEFLMSAELMLILSVSVAAGAALVVTGMHPLRAGMRARHGMTRAEFRDATGHARGVLGRAETAAYRSGQAADGARSEQARQETHDVPAPRGGKAYDPRPQEDRARRRIAYLLIALLAFMIAVLLAMVVFDVIPVGEIKEFGVILGPLVALVSAATAFYYATRR